MSSLVFPSFPKHLLQLSGRPIESKIWRYCTDDRGHVPHHPSRKSRQIHFARPPQSRCISACPEHSHSSRPSSPTMKHPQKSTSSVLQRISSPSLSQPLCPIPQEMTLPLPPPLLAMPRKERGSFPPHSALLPVEVPHVKLFDEGPNTNEASFCSSLLVGTHMSPRWMGTLS